MRFPISLLGVLLIVTGRVSCFIQGKDSFASLARRKRTIEPILDRLHALNLGLAGLLGLNRQEEPSEEAKWPQGLESKPSVLVLSPTIRHLYGHKEQQAPKQQQHENKQQQKLKGMQQQKLIGIQQQLQKKKNEPQHQKLNGQEHFFAKVQEEEGNSEASTGHSHSEEEESVYYAPVYTPSTQPYTTPSTRSTTTTTKGTTTTLAPLRYHYSRLTSPLPSTLPASPLCRSQIYNPAQASPTQKELQDIQVGCQHIFNQHGLHETEVVIKEDKRDPLLTWLRAPSPRIDPRSHPLLVDQNSNYFSEDLDKFTLQQEQNNIANDQPKEIRSSKRILRKSTVNENPQQTFYTFNRPFKAGSASPKDEIGEMPAKGRRIDAVLGQEILEEVFGEEKSPRGEEAKSQFRHFQAATTFSFPTNQRHFASNGHQPASNLLSLAQESF